ncbi:MAG: hypothetical protein HOJ77_02280 [Flavobacteriales bacterium]|jgi:hypothetical protein|nr:hypothetical protein [Flavobacteriales bacterium]
MKTKVLENYESFFREHIGDNGWLITLTFHDWWKWTSDKNLRNLYEVYPTTDESKKEFVTKTLAAYLNWENQELFNTKKNSNGFRRVAFYHSGDDGNKYPHIHLVMENFTKTKLRKPKYNDIQEYKNYIWKKWNKFDTAKINSPFDSDWCVQLTYWNKLVRYGVVNKNGCIDFDSIIWISK